MDNRTTSERDYQFYNYLTNVYPLYLLWTFPLLVSTQFFVLMISNLCARKRQPWYFCNLFLKDITVRVSKTFLFDFRQERPMQDFDRDDLFSLHGTPVYFATIQFVSIILVVILCFSTIVFWNAFAIDRIVNQCDSRYDCFVLYSTNLTPVDEEAIESCELYIPNSKNTTLYCFRFVQQYSRAFGEAGGFLFSMQLIANALIYIATKVMRLFLRIHIHFVYKKYHTDISRWQYKACYKLVSLFCTFTACVVLIYYLFLVL